MKTSFYLLLSTIVFLLGGCNLQEESGMPHSDPPLSDTSACVTKNGLPAVIFKALEVGQASHFVFFTGENYQDTSEFSIQYHPDTLVMEIVGKDDFGFRVKECITSGSKPNNELLFPDSVLYYYLKVENGYLKPHRTPDSPSGTFLYSRLFLTREIPLPLAKITAEEIILSGWKTNPVYFGLYREGFCENSMVNNAAYPYLNIVIDNSDMATDGHGTTWIYAPTAGLVRFFAVSPWTNKGSGWDLIPE